MKPTDQTPKPGRKPMAVAFRESFLGMTAGWFALQITYIVMILVDGTPGMSDLGWLPVWGMATGVVCLIAWLLICWPATVVLRGRLLLGKMGKVKGALIGGLFGGAAGFAWVMLDPDGYATRGNLVFALLAALAGAVAGWVISWRTILQARKRDFFEQQAWK